MSRHFDTATTEAVDAAVSALEKGGVTLMPADTVYGFFGRADLPAPRERVYEIKKRDRGKPFVLYTNADQVRRWAELTPTAEALIDKFWPQALALVLTKKPTVPDFFTGGSSTIAVMTAANHLITSVVDGVDAPLFGTTVNYSGDPSIKSAADAVGFLDHVDVMISDDSIPVYNQSSTIVDCTGDVPQVIREEAIPADDLRAFLPELAVDLDRKK